MADTYYNREGNRISRARWVQLFEDFDNYRLIERTDLDGYIVSTVWLGLNHATRGRPLIFETMVFDHEDSEIPHLTRRYATERKARKTHFEVVKELSASD